jgi:hypothetical protein
MPSAQGLGLVDQESTNNGGEHKGLKISKELLTKIRECFARLNICIESILLCDVPSISLNLKSLNYYSGKCNSCSSQLDRVVFSESEISDLCEAIKEKVLFKGDIYWSTMPKEFERFLCYWHC